MEQSISEVYQEEEDKYYQNHFPEKWTKYKQLQMLVTELEWQIEDATMEMSQIFFEIDSAENQKQITIKTYIRVFGMTEEEASKLYP